MLFLSEAASPAVVGELGLAVIGVAVQLIAFGSLPWIAWCWPRASPSVADPQELALDALTGLLIEGPLNRTLPPAAIYLWGFADNPPPPHAKRLAPEPAADRRRGRHHGALLLTSPPAATPAQALHPGLLPVHKI